MERSIPFHSEDTAVRIPKQHLFKVMFNLLLIEVEIAIEKFVDNVTAPKLLPFTQINTSWNCLKRRTHSVGERVCVCVCVNHPRIIFTNTHANVIILLNNEHIYSTFTTNTILILPSQVSAYFR